VIAAIWAQNEAGLIGAAGTVPWHVPEDLRRFARLTKGCALVMGRKTFDSLPGQGIGLPGRRNVVVTRDRGWTAPGAHVAASPAEGLELAAALDRAAGADSPIWVVGGGEIYRALIGAVELAEVTVVDAPGAVGDTFAPPLDGFRLDTRDPASGWATSTSGTGYRYETWRRA
jgi:dihydrofolate reductase